VVAGAIVVLLAGCGGSDESSAESWANDVCGRTVEWRDDVGDTVDTFRENPDLSGLASTMDDVVASTHDFVADLRKIGAPDTPSGDEAKAQVDQLANSIDARVQRVQAAAPAGGLDAVQTAADEISGGIDDVKTTTASIEALSGELRQGIEDASSCKELRKLGGASGY
jgi:hypothetical protein